jgi:hypothetical protein
MEREMVKTGGGTRAWTAAERAELIRTGKISGYEGHHINSVESSPELMANPNNIKFVKGRTEHLQEHGGSFQNPTSGNLMER